MEMNKNYFENIVGIMNRQKEKGLSKYGVLLEDNKTLSVSQRIEHLQEELIDGLQYCEHLKEACKDNLTVNDYQRMAMRTSGEYKSKHDMLRNAVYGLNGESGEVIDILKKHEFQGHAFDRDKIIDEAGDVCWYIAEIAYVLDVKLEDVFEGNINKLSKRYKNGFSKEESINRNK
jgi:NTP pyrophosphatase (non-canonical NTP hydrolase)